MSEMSQGALQELFKTGQAAVKADERVSIKNLPGGREYLIVRSNGEFTKSEVPLPMRKHQLNTVEDVTQWAQTMAVAGNRVVIYFGVDKIFATLDDRRLEGDHAWYEFEYSEEFKSLQKFAERDEGDEFDQKTLLIALRTDFYECFVDSKSRDSLIRSLRNIKAEQTSSIGSGRGTFEAGIQTSDGTAEKWPERLAMQCRVFNDPCLLKSPRIDVVFEVDPHRRTFMLWPTRRSIEDAINEARESAITLIRNHLDQVEGVLVYQGAP